MGNPPLFLQKGTRKGWFWRMPLFRSFVPGEHANVPSFRFSFRGNIRCTLVPVFIPEHPPKDPFGKPPFWQPPEICSKELFSKNDSVSMVSVPLDHNDITQTSGDAKNYKHKQILGIVPGMDGAQISVCVAFLLGEKGNT